MSSCCLYARVSTADQNCQLQLNEMRGWATRHDWPIYDEFVDSGFSGGKSSRPALDRMVKACEARLVDTVLVYKLDRLGRSVAHLTKLLQDFDRWGIRFIAISQGIDTDKSNPTSRLLLHILASVAEFERSLIRERTALGVANARANGKKFGQPQRVFRKDLALEMQAAGKSLREISRELEVPYSTLRQNMPNGKLPVDIIANRD